MTALPVVIGSVDMLQWFSPDRGAQCSYPDLLTLAQDILESTYKGIWEPNSQVHGQFQHLEDDGRLIERQYRLTRDARIV